MGGPRKTMAVEFGEGEAKINVFQTRPGLHAMHGVSKLSDNVPIKSQGHKSLAATPLTLVSFTLSFNKLCCFAYCLLSARFSP